MIEQIRRILFNWTVEIISRIVLEDLTTFNVGDCLVSNKHKNETSFFSILLTANRKPELCELSKLGEIFISGFKV